MMNRSNIFPLPELALIEVQGADAKAFLQGQLTNDVSLTDTGRAVYTGYCNPKGRLLATLVLWPSEPGGEAWRMIVHASLADALVKRLSMFVLRSKVRLSRSSTAIHARWAQGPSPEALEPWALEEGTDASHVAAPRGPEGVQRWWVIPHGADLAGAVPAAGSGLAAWQAADIAAGLPWVLSSTAELFLPQTLNLDLNDGLSFQKGCYPGQEVVARLHYRGSAKRRMLRGYIETIAENAPSLEGTDIHDARSARGPCGRVVNAAVSDGVHLLFEAPLADRLEADFRLGAPDGPRIDILPLPYSFKED